MSTTATETGIKTYTIDPAHSTARFTVRHMMISKVHGHLSEVTGTVNFDSNVPESTTFDVTIQSGSLTTHQEQRDAHLKSTDFLNVAEYPVITYKSKSTKKTGENEYEVTGDLTIRGITRELTLDVEATPEVTNPYGGYKIGINARGKINREDFGMTWNQAIEAGGVLVGKDVSLEIDVELDRPA